MRRETNKHSQTACYLGLVLIATMLSASKCYDTQEVQPSANNTTDPKDSEGDGTETSNLENDDTQTWESDDPAASDSDTVSLPADTEEVIPGSGSCSEVAYGNEYEMPTSTYDGVDVLIVVDNSGSMAEEQDILSTGVYTLINSLTRPLSPEADPEWGFSAMKNVRVAIVTSDMGLQWGGGQVGGNTTEMPGCNNDQGMNGELQTGRETDIWVESGRIKCEEGGGQCPDGWDCNTDHRCIAQGEGTVNCPAMSDFAETTANNVNADVATEVACMAQQGTDGCGMEQQLEAAVRGLENQPDFMVANHLLAVIVVSDEEDCSIRDKRLFETEEWRSGSSELFNVACNYPDANETYLFPTNAEDIQAIVKAHDDVQAGELETFYNKLVNLKGAAGEVIFGAIVGVPPDTGDAISPCQGNGVDLVNNACLDNNAMQIEVQEFEIEGHTFQHFKPACSRLTSNGATVTEARPGRRYVKTAMEFRTNGFVYSICNEDWSPAMRSVASTIARNIPLPCFDTALPWTPLPAAEQTALECPSCGTSACDMVVELSRMGAEVGDESCPDGMYRGLSATEKPHTRRRSRSRSSRRTACW